MELLDHMVALFLLFKNLHTTLHGGSTMSLFSGCLVLFAAHLLSRVQLFETPWTVAHQTLMSMEFSRQEYWSGLAFPTPGDLPNLGIELASLVSPSLAGVFFNTCQFGSLRSLPTIPGWTFYILNSRPFINAD